MSGSNYTEGSEICLVRCNAIVECRSFTQILVVNEGVGSGLIGCHDNRFTHANVCTDY